MSKKKSSSHAPVAFTLGFEVVKYLAGFLLRALENSFKDLAWIFTNGNTANTKFNRFYNDNFPATHPVLLAALKIVVVGAAIFFFGMWMLYFFLVVVGLQSLHEK